MGEGALGGMFAPGTEAEMLKWKLAQQDGRGLMHGVEQPGQPSYMYDQGPEGEMTEGEVGGYMLPQQPEGGAPVSSDEAAWAMKQTDERQGQMGPSIDPGLLAERNKTSPKGWFDAIAKDWTIKDTAALGAAAGILSSQLIPQKKKWRPGGGIPGSRGNAFKVR